MGAGSPPKRTTVRKGYKARLRRVFTRDMHAPFRGRDPADSRRVEELGHMRGRTESGREATEVRQHVLKCVRRWRNVWHFLVACQMWTAESGRRDVSETPSGAAEAWVVVVVAER